jgi:hypothetical protein
MVRRLSRTSTVKVASEQPISGAFIHSGEKDNDTESFYSQDKKPKSNVAPYIIPSNAPPPSWSYPTNPVPSIAYNNPMQANYASKIGQPVESTKIYNLHEYDQQYFDSSASVQKQRF